MEDDNFFNLAYELIEATKNHEIYRSKECINLIASEGLKSPAVKEMMNLCHDLESRYSEGENDITGHVKKRHYQGQKFIIKIENCVSDLMKKCLKSNFVDIRCVSGTHANLVTFKGLELATNNKKMVVAPLSCGAHISHDYTGLAGMIIGLETINHVFDQETMNIDIDKSATIIRASRPGIVTFGSSLFLFPHPIKELANIARETGAYVVYDSAHVLGLIIGGKFQDPIREGADFLTSSTHKTFPGPQGGLVCGNIDDDWKRQGAKKILNAIFPLSTSNTHLARLPALGITAMEMKIYGTSLAEQTILNAQIAGQCLFEKGINVLGEKFGFTKSHQIVIDVKEFGGGAKIAELLEEADIIVNKNILPYDDQRNKENPSGIRIGFQDVTRRGFRRDDIKFLCGLLSNIIKKEKQPQEIKNIILDLAKNFDKIEYGFKNLECAIKEIERSI